MDLKIETKNTMYVIRVLESKHLSHVYYGKKFNYSDVSDLIPKFNFEQGSSTSYSKELKPFSLGNTLLEVSTFGKGDYREPSLHIELPDGSRVSDFKYVTHQYLKEKKPLKGLPSLSSDCDTLLVNLVDEVLDIELTLEYNAYYDFDIITRNMKIKSNKQDIILDKIMSMNIDFYDSDYELITLDGAWIRERHINLRNLYGITKIDSKKGVSSADHNPFIALKRKETNEFNGDVYGFSLIYSGNFEIDIEVNPHNLLRVMLGINSFDFKWKLKKGETFQTPEAIMTFSDKGLNGMSNNFHEVIKKKLLRGEWANKPRPIAINNWEATYFDFNESKLLKLAKKAKDLGMELFVLDDGWFGKRDDDNSSLGDYFVNKKKLKSIPRLNKKINQMGLMFGIWVEPEMISEDSELYKLHPEWAIKLPNREVSLGRNQMILDLANPDVCDYIYNSLSELFSSSNIEYCKWDMNRNFSDIYSNYLSNEDQYSFNHRYVLGLYSILEKLNENFPHILFESCSSGGNRFDLGMLYYMPQTWTSDNTDGYERQIIQYGTSMIYPQLTMSNHVSSSPNHQTFRITPIETRFNVACFGLLGYELDLNKLTNVESKIIKEQIKWYKANRLALQFGEFKRLLSPFDNNKTRWMVKGDNILIGEYQTLSKPNPGYEIIKLPFVEDIEYEFSNRTQYVDVRTFGDHLNRVMPFKIKINGLIHTLISNNYLFALESELKTLNGEMIKTLGIVPKQLFTGTGYDDTVKLTEDFSSRIYILKGTNNGQ